MFGSSIEAAFSIGEKIVGELCGKHDPFAPTFERLAHELLVGERAVRLGGIQKGHAKVERPVDHAKSILLGGCGAVIAGHPHRAKAHLGNEKTLTKLTLF